ncbi:MAG: hypothetical protein QM778_00370 [Myxococcales bacterium]
MKEIKDLRGSLFCIKTLPANPAAGAHPNSAAQAAGFLRHCKTTEMLVLSVVILLFLMNAHLHA